MPVYKLLEEMPYTEFLKWVSFFEKQPVGWQEDNRTFLLMKSFGFKGSAESVFASLKQIKNQQIKQQENDRAIPKGQFLNKLLSAKNGDSVKIGGLR